ncbi:DUF5680 domain-containing protein [Tabrizicola sp.]|uniref:DUF5680 domain-containing protein n=1 Tax=Tabrizicola sp. TaxID=2005166 RepID=UPI003F3104F0
MQHSELHRFAIRAKKATYIGGGAKAPSSRPNSHDLAFSEGDWRYLDSYFGGTDFLGQEVIWLSGEPVWAMNYYGRISRPDLIDANRAGQTLLAALSTDGSQGRLIDNLDWQGPHGSYSIRASGDIAHFAGRETISVDGAVAYELDYHGGLVKP